jgi:hypothetical protein
VKNLTLDFSIKLSTFPFWGAGFAPIKSTADRGRPTAVKESTRFNPINGVNSMPYALCAMRLTAPGFLKTQQTHQTR